jgi:hypothetical protein
LLAASKDTTSLMNCGGGGFCRCFFFCNLARYRIVDMSWVRSRARSQRYRLRNVGMYVVDGSLGIHILGAVGLVMVHAMSLRMVATTGLVVTAQKKRYLAPSRRIRGGRATNAEVVGFHIHICSTGRSFSRRKSQGCGSARAKILGDKHVLSKVRGSRSGMKTALPGFQAEKITIQRG